MVRSRPERQKRGRPSRALRFTVVTRHHSAATDWPGLQGFSIISIRPDGNIFLDARVPSLGDNAAKNALKDYGLDFSNLNVLNEHGLIISDYNSWHDIRACIGIASVRVPPALVRPFSFQPDSRIELIQALLLHLGPQDGNRDRIGNPPLERNVVWNDD